MYSTQEDDEYMKTIYSKIIFILLLAAIVIPAKADVFPAEPFNGLQIVYSVSGAVLKAPVDKGGFTTSRTVDGIITEDILTVSGTAKASGGWGATLDVILHVDGQEDKTFHQEKFPKDGLANDVMNQEFSLSLSVPRDARSASFSINMEGSYNAGSRGLTVGGKLEGETVPIATTPISPTKTTTGESKVLMDTWNKYIVNNNAQCRPTFTITGDSVITYINTYHWNNGQGVTNPGAITLFNLDTGKSYGTWPAKGEPGANGVPNVVWVVRPDIEIPAGRYEIADSDNPTWSNNQGSNNCGFSRVDGIEGTHRTVLPAPARTIAPSTPVQTRVVSTQVQTVIPYTPVQTRVEPTPIATAPNIGIIVAISMVLIVYTRIRKI